MKPVTHIAFTGGPCAGKSASLPIIAARLRTSGIRAYVVPEVASMLIVGGSRPWEMDDDAHFAFQVCQVRTQLAFENGVLDIARLDGDGPAVVLCDRGLMDGAGYFGLERWPRVLAAAGLTLDSAGCNRYDAVLHLESAAVGSPADYPGSSNLARWQNASQAAESDRRIWDAWARHPARHVVPYQPLFRGKLEIIDTMVRAIIRPA